MMEKIGFNWTLHRESGENVELIRANAKIDSLTIQLNNAQKLIEAFEFGETTNSLNNLMCLLKTGKVDLKEGDAWTDLEREVLIRAEAIEHIGYHFIQQHFLPRKFLLLFIRSYYYCIKY